MRLSTLCLLLLILSLLNTSLAFHNRRSRGISLTNISNLQQPASTADPEPSPEENNEESGNTPENNDDSSLPQRPEGVSEHAIIDAMMGFNATSRLSCVREYMESTTQESDDFCPDFATIARSSTDNIDNELLIMELSYEPNMERAERIYRHLRGDLNQPLLMVADSNADVSFASNTFDVRVSLSRLFDDVLGLSHNYNELHRIFGIGDSVGIDAFGCDYPRRENENNDDPYCLVYIPVESQYHIVGGNIYFESIVVDSTEDNNPRTRRISYHGILHLDALVDIPTEYMNTIDRSISVVIHTYNRIIEEEFDRDNPRFTLTIHPDPLQVDITNIIQNLFNLDTLEFHAPRGLSTIRYLPALSARVDIENRMSTHASIVTQTPRFEFATAHVGISGTTLRIEFEGPRNYDITINGMTSLNNLDFYNTMSYSFGDRDYRILLTGDEDEVLDYQTLGTTLVDSLGVENSNFLPSNPHALRLLTRMNITESGLHFARPVIRLSFSPYLLYRVQGFHDTNGNGDLDCFIQGTMVNIDGELLAFYSYLFDYSRSQNLFQESFRAQSGDTAIIALNIIRFRFTTYNRDFDLGRYDDFLQSDFAQQIDTHWYQGLNATVDIDLIDS
jgi:hypothetical protein